MNSKPVTVNLSIIFIVLLLSATFSTHSMGASVQATVSVKIVRPLSISNNSDMSFGNITPGETTGVVALQYDGSRQATGGVLLETGSFSTPAHFTVKGTPNGTFVLTLPQFINMTDDNGNSIAVDNFTSQSGNTITFDKYGQKELKVGASLHVKPDQPLGYYNGQLNIEINYD